MISAASAPPKLTTVRSEPTNFSASRTVQCINPLELPDWDASLARHPDGSFFHSAAWSAVLQDTYGYTAKYLVVREAGNIRALLPLMEVNSWLTGRRGISLPFTDECDPLHDDEQTAKNLIEDAMELGKTRGWKYAEFRGGRKSFREAPASLVFYGHQIELQADEKTLFEKLAGSVRQGIRKAEKSGVTLESSTTLEGMKEFYDLFCLTRKKHGMPPQSFQFFKNIQKHVLSKNLGRVILARFDGRPVAAAVHLNFGKRAIYKFGASDERFQHLRANNLVMWEAIKTHARNGLRHLHLGRTSLANDGLRRFKLNWGAFEERIEYVKYDLRNNCFLQDKDQASGWHNSVFQRTPVFLARLIGARLYPHWA